MGQSSQLWAALLGGLVFTACGSDAALEDAGGTGFDPPSTVPALADGGAAARSDGGQAPGAAAVNPPASDAAAATPAMARDAQVGVPQADASPVSDAGTPVSSDASVPPSDGGAPAPAPVESQGCAGGATLKPGDSSATLQVGGVSRTYLLHVPQSYTGKSAVPLVLDFHPLLMDAAYQRSNSGYAQLADKEGFIVAYPQGVDPAWNVGPCCTKKRDVDDLGFAKALVAKLKSDACLNVKRVYAVGYSNGGGMSHHVACNAADVFASVAPAAFDLLVENEQPCHPVRPISVLAFRSTNDDVVPYAGGASTPPTLLLGYSLNTIHFLGAEGTFKRWAELNMCSDTPHDTGMGCKTYSQCAAGTEVTLCTSASAGHATGPAAQGWATLKRFTLP